jgi:hypothetical protein
MNCEKGDIAIVTAIGELEGKVVILTDLIKTEKGYAWRYEPPLLKLKNGNEQSSLFDSALMPVEMKFSN